MILVTVNIYFLSNKHRVFSACMCIVKPLDIVLIRQYAFEEANCASVIYLPLRHSLLDLFLESFGLRFQSVL